MLNIKQKPVSDFSNDLIDLIKSLEQKRIPTKYLYDDIGSKLFEKICDTNEYYLTRTEKKILEENSISILDVSMADEFLELGSGSSKKTKVLILDAVDKVKNFKYISFDISNKALQMCHNELKNISNDLKIELIQGDFFKELNVLKKSTKNRMFLFLGSTIGNFDNDTAINFLTSVSKVMNKNDTILIGVDKIKDNNVLEAAYNDDNGITGEFNKNILNVINKKYNLNFKKENFLHTAIFNKNKSQIEMYLRLKKDQKIIIPDGKEIFFKKGDKILTEISRKFSENAINEIFNKSSLNILKTYSDINNYFSLYLLNKYTY
ncbi:MAG: Histidine N-alpha-methyltransferase [Alphaproteobacteria bacterium MarineAlpha9_Bin4]|nr:MAG: Histidine N-alpha-methyltransferase [Alphaproteobacteria bacterium MarineAlpha9_Bin4]